MMMKPSDPICCQGAKDNGRNGVRLSCAISNFKSTFRPITTNRPTSRLVSLVRGHQKYSSVKSEVSSIHLFCGHSVGLILKYTLCSPTSHVAIPQSSPTTLSCQLLLHSLLCILVNSGRVCGRIKHHFYSFSLYWVGSLGIKEFIVCLEHLAELGIIAFIVYLAYFRV